LTLNGNWNNTLTLHAENSTVNLGGTFTLATLGTFTRSGGTVNLTGTLDDTGTSLALDTTTGSWQLNGGTIRNGAVTATAGSALIIPVGSSATLAGVVLSTDVVVQNLATLTIVNGLTLNAVLTLASAPNPSTLVFHGTQTLAGNGQVLFGGNNVYNYAYADAGTLTIGPNVIVHGASGTLGNSSLPLINQGTISADIAGGTITIHANPFTNTGTTNQLNGGKLLINP
jgi:hypothetical protein